MPFHSSIHNRRLRSLTLSGSMAASRMNSTGGVAVLSWVMSFLGPVGLRMGRPDRIVVPVRELIEVTSSATESFRNAIVWSRSARAPERLCGASRSDFGAEKTVCTESQLPSYVSSNHECIRNPSMMCRVPRAKARTLLMFSPRALPAFHGGRN
jgi:hypothetical protein